LKKRDGDPTRFFGCTHFIGLEGVRIWQTYEIMRLRTNGRQCGNATNEAGLLGIWRHSLRADAFECGMDLTYFTAPNGYVDSLAKRAIHNGVNARITYKGKNIIKVGVK
jgi:hypothetical protein